MAVDDKEQDKPLRRPPPPRQPPVQPIPPQPPPPPPQYQQPIPPPPPPPGAYPIPPPTVRTQRTAPPPPPPQPSQPASQPETVARRGVKAEKTQPLPLVGIIIAVVAALMGVITTVFSVFNEALSIPLLAAAVAGTNIAMIIIAMAIWRLLGKK